MNAGRFPQRIKRGSCVVTIYKTPTKGYDAFTVVHYDATGARCRRMFTSYAQAHRVAKDVAMQLAAGKPEVHVLTGHELVIYRRALRALNGMEVELDVAATQFAQAVQVLGTTAVLEAVKTQVQAQQPGIRPKLVAQVVKELLASKAEKGRSGPYLSDLKVRLERVAAAFPRPLASVTPNDIDEYLRSLKVSARTKNNFRAVIGTLIRFGQQRGYVGRDHTGVGMVEKASTTPSDVHVFTPDQIRRLLGQAKAALLPSLAIGAFSGVRSEELKRLYWEDVKLKQGHIEIKGANSKTKIRRLIPIQSNLKAWLLPHAKDVGPITPFSDLALQFAKLSRTASVPWIKNGLRHSYISYRTAQAKNLAAVALESGNSAQVISRHYLKVVTRDEARKWFGVFPDGSRNGTSAGQPH